MNDYCDIEQIAEQPYVVSIDDKPFLNNKSVIIDCGACVGDFSKPLIEKYNCTVYAYEPDIRNYRILKYNLSKYDNAIILNSAISDMDGKEKFYIGEFNTASSLYSSHRGLGKDVYFIKTTTIGKEIRENHIELIDLLKIDIEGTEKTVIPSLTKETLSKIKQIVVEFHLQSEIADYIAEDVEVCRNHLKNNKFKEVIYDNRYARDNNKASYGVYLNENWLI